jgi:hypothetical protein
MPCSSERSDRVFRGDPVRAREALRRILKGGRIVLHPQRNGEYRAEATLLPLVAVAQPQMTKPPGDAQGSSSGRTLG